MRIDEQMTTKNGAETIQAGKGKYLSVPLTNLNFCVMRRNMRTLAGSITFGIALLVATVLMTGVSGCGKDDNDKCDNYGIQSDFIKTEEKCKEMCDANGKTFCKFDNKGFCYCKNK